MIKVHIITQNEPFYIPKMIKYLLDRRSASYEISSFTVLKPHRKSKSLFHWFSERAKVYTSYELILAGFAFVFVKVYSLVLFLGPGYSVRTALLNAGVPEFKTNDINNSDYINQIKSTAPDVIISISCPQLFGKKLLDIPSYFSINAHGTLLPKHRGVFGTWWTLFCDDSEAGGTIHTMELKLDKGEIFWQEAFPVEKKDTQYSLAYKTKKSMAVGLVAVLNRLYKNDIQVVNQHYKESYHRAPSKEQGKEFHKKGKTVIALRDLKKMLATFF
jgi:methionyl-tRNA formyltransferase